MHHSIKVGGSNPGFDEHLLDRRERPSVPNVVGHLMQRVKEAVSIAFPLHSWTNFYFTTINFPQMCFGFCYLTEISIQRQKRIVKGRLQNNRSNNYPECKKVTDCGIQPYHPVSNHRGEGPLSQQPGSLTATTRASPLVNVIAWSPLTISQLTPASQNTV